jgi:tetratricopeptide (TPR) repeat protein
MKELDKAEEYSISSMKYGKSLPDYKDTLAEIYFRKGKVDKAIETIREALQIKPRNAWYKLQLDKFSDAQNQSSPSWDSGQAAVETTSAEEGDFPGSDAAEEIPSGITEMDTQ